METYAAECDPKDILKKAVMCDKKGRYLEAECLYTEGTDILMEIVDEESDFSTKKLLYDRIAQYVDRTKQIQLRLQKQLARGDRVTTVNIKEDDVNHSYQTLFDGYLNHDVREVVLEEPNLYEASHFQNLIVFLETLMKTCSNFKYIRIITKPAAKAADNQEATFDEIKQEMAERDITVHFHMDNTLHSPRIVLNNGYIIKTSRGLHFFKEHRGRFCIGQSDYDFRKCLATEIDVWRTQT